jgi:hypothetical protein
MNRTVAFGLAGLLVLAAPVKADLAPRPAARPAYKFTVEVDPKATVARLVVPAGQPGGFGAPPGTPRRGALSMPTIMVAVALTLALAFGGVWLVRHKGGLGNARGPLAVLAALALTAAGAALYADIPGPGRRPPRPPDNLQPPPVPLEVLATLDRVEVQILPRGDRIRLIIPPAMKDKLPGAKPAPKGD